MTTREREKKKTIKTREKRDIRKLINKNINNKNSNKTERMTINSKPKK